MKGEEGGREGGASGERGRGGGSGGSKGCGSGEGGMVVAEEGKGEIWALCKQQNLETFKVKCHLFFTYP